MLFTNQTPVITWTPCNTENKLEHNEILKLLRDISRDELDIGTIIKAYLAAPENEDNIVAICRNCGLVIHSPKGHTLDAVVSDYCETAACHKQQEETTN